jgi:hypothetical protein
MDLHEIIEQSQDYIRNAVIAEQEGDLSSAYECLDRLYDLLTEELVPMEHP